MSTAQAGRIPKNLRGELPELVWLFFMGIVLYWVHDPTDGALRTRLLTRRTCPIVVRAIGLTRLPMLRSSLNDLIALIDELKILGVSGAPSRR